MFPGKRNSISKTVLFLLAIFCALGFTSDAQSRERTGVLSPSVPLVVDFSQASNKNPTLGDVVWIKGSLQQNNSAYYEGMSTLQRLILLNIPKTPGHVHRLTFSHQASEGKNHAYDFITSWPQALQAGSEIGGRTMFVDLNEYGSSVGPPANLGDIYVFLRESGFSMAPGIPDNMGSLLGDDVAAKVAAYESCFGNRTVKIYGNEPISAVLMSFDGYSDSGELFANYKLTWVSSSHLILIEMAGHLAVGIDPFEAGIGYRAGRGAAAVGSGMYHFRLDYLDGRWIGWEDNQIIGADLLLPPPVCHVTPESEVACLGESVTFTGHPAGGTPPYTWEWTKPPNRTVLSTDSTLIISNTKTAQAGKYKAAVTDKSGFVSACYAYLNVLPQPVCDIASGSDSLCVGDITTWSAKQYGMQSYEWSEALSGFASTEQHPLIGEGLDPGTYTFTLVVTDYYGCTNTCTRDLTVLPPPGCDVVTWVDSLCVGDTTTWCAEPDDMESFEWSEPVSGFFSDEQCPLIGEGLDPGTYTYTLVVTDYYGCADTCTRDLTVLPPPGCDIVNESDSLCFGDITLWCAEPDDMESFEWSEPVSGFFSDEQCPLIGEGLDPGTYTYTLVVTDYYGCMNTCTRNLIVWELVPVELANFKATAGQDVITIEWVTASEKNCQRWEIYRSDGEDGNYEKIGELNGQSSVEMVHSYQWVDRVVSSGVTYFYKLKQVDFDGSPWWSHAVSTITGLAVPESFALSQNYPNPFNTSTEIRYQIPKNGHVNLKIYNNLGKEVRTLVDMDQTANWYVVTWDGRNDMGLEVAGGIYLCRLKAGNFKAVKKMVLLK